MDRILFRVALSQWIMPDLTPLQQGILVDLCVFDVDKSGNIARRLGTHRNTASGLLSDLADKGMITKRGEAVYELTDAGRETGRELLMRGYNPYVDDEPPEKEDDEDEATA